MAKKKETQKKYTGYIWIQNQCIAILSNFNNLEKQDFINFCTIIANNLAVAHNYPDYSVNVHHKDLKTVANNENQVFTMGFLTKFVN